MLRWVISDAEGREMEPISVRRQASPFATLFPADILSVRLKGGGEVSLFLKHLGAEQADHPEKQRRDREVLVYQRLFRYPGLPLARFYGERRDHGTGRHHVFLEYVDGWNLKYQHMEHWFEAARRLGQLHAHFAERARDLFESDFLLRFDHRYFRDWARRAVEAVGAYSAGFERRLRTLLGPYRQILDMLERQPVTLVHNDLSPKNVIADTSRRPARICFVDWEMAGIGCGLLDLVHLRYGLDEENAARMLAAYRQGLDGSGLIPTDEIQLARLVAACELHKTLYRLAFSPTWRLPTSRIREWMEDSERLLSAAIGRADG